VASHSVLVVTDVDLKAIELEKWNVFCRSKNITFVYARSHGLFASVFADHGARHIVND